MPMHNDLFPYQRRYPTPPSYPKKQTNETWKGEMSNAEKVENRVSLSSKLKLEFDFSSFEMIKYGQHRICMRQTTQTGTKTSTEMVDEPNICIYNYG